MQGVAGNERGLTYWLVTIVYMTSEGAQITLRDSKILKYMWLHMNLPWVRFARVNRTI